MKENEYVVSIIMPTYNSARTLEKSLKSIREQDIRQDSVEILILDGDSSDRTCSIAREYGATILENKRRLPEFAKQQGMLEAQGKYGIFIDSDEAFVRTDSLSRRVEFLQKHPEVKNLVSTGQICVQNEKGINRYANFIGDPFSNFVYRYDGYDRKYDICRKCKYQRMNGGILFQFGENDMLPLFDALGNMFEIETAKKIYNETGRNKSFAANIFSNMVRQTKCAAMLEDDYVWHEPGLSVSKYLNKLKWRVKNNLFQTEGVGFSERSKQDFILRKRQMLFVPYCGLIVPVVLDAIRMAIRKKDIWFILHIFFAEYVFIMIVWYMFLKVINYPVRMESTYGGMK